MLTLFFAIIFSLLVVFFAIQNNAPAVIHLLPFSFFTLPVYLIVIFSILIGLIVGWIFNLSSNVVSFFTIRGKNAALSSAQKKETELQNKIHDLEIENAKLRGEKDATVTATT